MPRSPQPWFYTDRVRLILKLISLMVIATCAIIATETASGAEQASRSAAAQ